MKTTNVIGIAGTAKNTGKTTTLSALVKESFCKKIPIAITGIGFDGEELDNVTLLPKPRLTVYPQTIVTTSERCLEISTAKTEILHHTGFFTSLGEVIILRVVQEGLIVVAGPNKKNELQIVLNTMRQFQPEIIFVDGSLNRIAPMAVVDSIIFTTGGARSTDISVITNEMKAIETIFHLPITTIDRTNCLEMKTLLEISDVEKIKDIRLENITSLYISKLISPVALHHLAEVISQTFQHLNSIIFSDPFALLVNENIPSTTEAIKKLQQANIRISYTNAPKLRFITANPFYPMLEGNRYSAQFLDKEKLLNTLRFSCTVPVLNTKEIEPNEMFEMCIEYYHKK